jgi:phosphoribosylformimino-5-aminoimidazole carboxamide ribotide isomerase
MAFEVIPAIDLIGGRVVRLRRGAFDQETSYGEDPAALANLFSHAGARWLHVVDLDGARHGVPANRETIARIVAGVGEGTAAEVAGGLRTEAAVDEALAAGAARVVLGTAAVSDPAFAGRAVLKHGRARIVAAIDVRDGHALGEGWRAGATGPRASEAIVALAGNGVELFEVTAINRDGLLEGPDLGLLTELVALRHGQVIASGGVSTLPDIRAVAELGCAGVILGRAIYEGRLDLREAIEVAAGLS